MLRTMETSAPGQKGSGPLNRSTGAVPRYPGGEAPSSRRAQGGEAPQTRRIFIECAWTHVAGRNTGIQRVVRSICSRCGEVGRDLGVRCVPVVFEGARFWGVRPAASPALIPSPVRSALQHSGLLLAGFLHILFPRHPEISHAFVKGSSKVLLSPLTWPHRKERLAWRDGDVLILLDASWHLKLWDAVAEARKAGVRVVAVVHDLIPLTHPQFCGQGHIRMFDAWFRNVCEHSDALFGVSDTVRGELSRRLRSDPSLGGAVARPVDYFHHGCDFSRRDGQVPKRSGEKIRRGLKEAFAGANGAYLTVGTLEPRKNHVCLLNAFERIWQTRPEARLCIAGARGLRSGPLRNRVRRHVLYGKRLFLFHDLSDAELSYGYARARALIFPSLVEGFGLPLVEALDHGAPVFASDIPVFREIGEGHCVFFDPDASGESLARLVIDYETAGPVRNEGRTPEGKTFRGIRWTESCRSLLSQALRTASANRNSGTRRFA